MKGIFLGLVLIVLTLNLFGQDKICLKDESIISCEIEHVEGNIIQYFDHKQSASYNVMTDTILYYYYNNELVINSKLPYDRQMEIMRKVKVVHNIISDQKVIGSVTANNNAIYLGYIFNNDRVFTIGYERVLSKYFTFNLDCEAGVYHFVEGHHYYTSYNNDNNTTTRVLQQDMEYTGFGITPEIRYYLFYDIKSAPRKLFVGSYYRHLFIKRTHNNYEDNTTVVSSGDMIYGLGFDVGYKFGKDRLMVEPLIGGGYSGSSGFELINDESKFLQFDKKLKKQMFWRFAIKIGVRF